MADNPNEIIQQILKKINNAWIQGNPKEMEEFFHEDMVIAIPGGQRVCKGKNACIDSYSQFIKNSKIHTVKESEYCIDVWSSTAVASYSFEIDYEMNNKRYYEKGTDLFVFNLVNDKWLAVWRTVLSVPENTNV
ncbi:nuclear transport factor 2 family protein [candidate division KSB1 bacterium]